MNWGNSSGVIEYNIVDEYDGETVEGPNSRSAEVPLSLEELVDFFLKGWDLLGVLNANFQDHGNPADMVKGFVSEASSSFYAQFGQAINARIDEWLVDHEVLPELEDEEDGEDE